MKYKYHSFTANRSEENAVRIYKQRIDDAVYIYNKHNQNFKDRNCPICNSKNSTSIDRFINLYNIDLCNVCNSSFVNPVPDINAIIDYYDNCECNRMLSNVIKSRFDKNDYINDERVGLIVEQIKASGINNKSVINILEVGSNNGAFLSRLKHGLQNSFDNIQFNLYGVDIDSTAVNNPVDKDLNLIVGLAEEISEVDTHKEKYDFILHFELIEHLGDPIGFVKSINKMLKDDGVMIFTTPNMLGLDNQALNYNDLRYLAHALFPPMHLNAFTPQNISHFLIINGFSVKDIKTPGKFDIDIVTLSSSSLNNELFKDVANLPEETRALLQELIVKLYASSHMQCVAGKLT